MNSYIVYDDCSLLAKEVMDGSLTTASEKGGSLISYKNPQKIAFVPGRALKCSAEFQSTGRVPAGIYEIEKDRGNIYWKTTVYTYEPSSYQSPSLSSEQIENQIQEQVQDAKNQIINEVNNQ